MSQRATNPRARDRAAAMRAAQARAERRRQLLLAVGAIVLVLLIVAGLVVAKLAGGGGSSSTTTAKGGAASKSVASQVTSVPSSVLDKVGVGSAQVAPRQVSLPRLTAGGKPRFLYVGADYCPYCAAERWAIVEALSRFCTWSHLGTTESASNDVYPSTQTLSFHGAGYTSRYLSFTGVEKSTNQLVNGQYAPLDKLTAADQKIVDTYDKAPYTAGGIPFLDIAGDYLTSGSTYSPEVLKDKTREQIAAALANPNDPIAKAVDGSANILTAAICDATGARPTNVCNSKGVSTAAIILARAQTKSQ
ncbi:MAG: hypothetical protein QOE01_2672 [Actinomycetota bacterium]|nr:hypothetical protein [Actinomycetota bacterium]